MHKKELRAANKPGKSDIARKEQTMIIFLSVRQ